MPQQNTPMISIYAETISLVQPYCVTTDKIASSLSALDCVLDITVAHNSTPDIGALERADFIVAPRINTALIKRHALQVKLVHCLNAGVERYMPLDWLPPHAVFTNSSGIHHNKAYEYAMMALLMLNARMPAFATAQRQTQWRPMYTMPIKGKSVAIIGTGAIGNAVAEAAVTLGLTSIGVSRSGTWKAPFKTVVTQTLIDEILPQVDFVVLACPLTDATRNLMSTARIGLLKENAAVLNMARGPVVDASALTAALSEGKLSGVMADVFDQEPLPSEDPLWSTPNFCITPHISCDSPIGYVEAGLDILADNIRRLQHGEPLRNQIDPQRQY